MRKILLVEDEEAVYNLISTHLTSERFIVKIATSGEQALQMMKNESFHLAILDIMLPGMDGIELLRIIRQNDSLPILMLSAKGSDIDKVIGLSMGADDYLSKPFSLIELSARVKALLRRISEGIPKKEEEIIVCGDIEVNLGTCEVKVRGETVKLTAKEYILLTWWMERQNRVVTKAQIYEAVWEEEYVMDDNTVMVHVHRLRNKIEQDPNKPEIIQTVRGLGYRLVGKG